MSEPSIARIFSEAASGSLSEQSLFESLSIFGRPLYRALADLRGQIDVFAVQAEPAFPGARQVVTRLLGAAIVTGGCRKVLKSVIRAANALPKDRGIRQSLQFRLAGLQAEQDAVTALLLELLETFTAAGVPRQASPRFELFIKAVFEHLVRIQALEPVVLMSGEAFDENFHSEFRTEQTGVLTAAALLLPEGMGRTAVEPISAVLGLHQNSAN